MGSRKPEEGGRLGWKGAGCVCRTKVWYMVVPVGPEQQTALYLMGAAGAEMGGRL